MIGRLADFWRTLLGEHTERVEVGTLRVHGAFSTARGEPVLAANVFKLARTVSDCRRGCRRWEAPGSTLPDLGRLTWFALHARGRGVRVPLAPLVFPGQ